MGVFWIGIRDGPDEEFTGHAKLRDYSGIIVCNDYKPFATAGDGLDTAAGDLLGESGPMVPKRPLENVGGKYVSAFYFKV